MGIRCTHQQTSKKWHMAFRSRMPIERLGSPPFTHALWSHSGGGEHLLVACSALKQRYRDTLNSGLTIVWVYLKGSYALILERLQRRQRHFMHAQMLDSQFADLEEPTNAIIVDVAVEPSVAVRQIVSALPAAPS